MSPWGVSPFDDLRKRRSGFYRFRGFGGDGAAHKNKKRREVYVRRCPKVVFKSLVTRGS
ncbi:hypothetical protein I3400192H8_02950 [Dialister sp. i34-0019-2H8]